MAGDLDSSESRFAPPEGNGDGSAAAVEPQVLAPMAFRMPRHALLELPYTAAADPEIESDIRTLLEQITSSVVADLQPAAILVRGSLGRGEGAAFRADRETQVTSDVELVAVLTGRGATVRAWKARRRTAVLRDTLAETFAVPQLDLVTVPAQLLREPPPSLTTFELLRSSRLLSGTIEIARPSAVPVERVPASGLMRRLRRAGNGLLFAWSRLGVGDGELPEGISRAVRATTDTSYLACGDVWLFRTRHYDHRLAVRAEWLRLPFSAGPGLTARLRDEYQIAAREMLFPSPRGGFSRAQSVARWERAAVEWMGCFRACRQRAWWGRYGLELHRAGIHPVRHALEELLEPVRHREEGTISVHAQRTVLPMLIEWTLDGWDDPVRRDRVAALLNSSRDEARDLSYLVLKFLKTIKLPHTPAATPQALPALSSGS
ncbi:MAG TPA: hypothetical protein VKB45_04620 [Gemmatimonadales bacterium]|nr:hypothetical protein [Gemmatimonadales bacterium]